MLYLVQLGVISLCSNSSFTHWTPIHLSSQKLRPDTINVFQPHFVGSLCTSPGWRFNTDVGSMMSHFYLVRLHIVVIYFFTYCVVVFYLTVMDHVRCKLDTI